MCFCFTIFSLAYLSVFLRDFIRDSRVGNAEELSSGVVSFLPVGSRSDVGHEVLVFDIEAKRRIETASRPPHEEHFGPVIAMLLKITVTRAYFLMADLCRS